MSDGQVIFEITADGKHAIASVKDVTKAIEGETKKWDKTAGQATDGIDKSFAKMAGKIVGTLTAAGVVGILTKWGGAAVDAASDLREVQNVVDTVFGDGAGKIEAWSKKAGQQFGLTETQAKKYTSTLGAMMKSSGLAGDQIISMSTDLAGLAADMASFYNLDFDVAFQKLRSGISGETEPLKQLGVNMSVANLNAFALKQGLKKTFDQMDQGEQTMLRYQYIMQATADAQGDFAKTADGYANSQRRIQTAIETIKTTAGTLLMNVVEPLTSGFADFLSQVTKAPENTIFDQFNAIELDTASKLNELEVTYNKAEDIVKLLDDISRQTVTLNDGSVLSFESLFSELGNVEKNGGDVAGYVASLGLNVDAIIQKYNVWKESTRQLTSLVPELTSVIDSESYALNGGTEALQKNLDEWKAYQEKKLAWAAYYAKEQALVEKKSSVYLFEFDAGTAQKSVDRARKALENVWKASFDDNGNVINDKLWTLNAIDYEKYRKDVEHYNILLKEANDATEALAKNTSDFSAAEEYLADEHERLVGLYGEEEQAARAAGNATDEYAGKTSSAWKEATTFAQEAVKALADYVAGVKDSTEQSVNSIVKGFEKISRPVSELESQRGKLIEEQQGLDRSAKDYEEKWNAIEEKIKGVNQQIEQFEPKGMKGALQSQIAFMDEYMKNLEKAKSMGLSDALLASLSDGSVNSAEYLMQLVADPQAAQQIDELYNQVQEKKKSFTDALTDQKLSVDETYQAMLDKAKQTVSELDLEGEAAAATGNTVAGMAKGISDHVPEVASAISDLLSQFDRLSRFGFSFGFGDGGFNLSLDGSHRTGLDFVPFDGYLAELHAGEGILTEEENRIWQRFKYGQNSVANVDYDMLGTVFRDNAGGDVFLSGRVVGQVLNAQQARDYRTLTRSGWRG